MGIFDLFDPKKKVKNVKTYTLQVCENYIDKYINEWGGQMATIEEGSLGLGIVMLYGAEKRKTTIIKEMFVSEWSSTHTIIQYNKMPKKYEKYL